MSLGNNWFDLLLGTIISDAAQDLQTVTRYMKAKLWVQVGRKRAMERITHLVMRILGYACIIHVLTPHLNGRNRIQ